jgi:phosphopantetheinyl transferase|tara:strand:- start:218 stop:856 length:639 start_codon:yes stop_codon:yes gene_type:complete
MRTFLFKIPENNYEIDKYINSTDLKYLKPFVGKIRMRKMYGIILQKFVIKLNYNIPYKEILIKRNAYNKPYYNNKLFYNLSYSENYIIIAYSQIKPIGIDIQNETEKIANVLMKYGNKPRILKNSIGENIKIWTKIESYLKMIGYGLSKLDNIKILSNNNIIDKSTGKKFVQRDITKYLPEQIWGTITTTYDNDNIVFYNINIDTVLDELNN